ncbi:unnamed protein product [Heterotrigona itama]|uniref:Uncharacterized protein n=1 Tax=Heterotrigona itama TaxID=395501 RepID=A0A6V7HBY1_9HYME|nr:unnamed protein product [Heterotrigona itama]
MRHLRKVVIWIIHRIRIVVVVESVGRKALKLYTHESDAFSCLAYRLVRVVCSCAHLSIAAAARYIAEQINVDKPLLISISLKDYEPDTLKTIITAINDMKAR